MLQIQSIFVTNFNFISHIQIDILFTTYFCIYLAKTSVQWLYSLLHHEVLQCKIVEDKSCDRIRGGLGGEAKGALSPPRFPPKTISWGGGQTNSRGGGKAKNRSCYARYGKSSVIVREHWHKFSPLSNFYMMFEETMTWIYPPDLKLP